MKTEIKDMLLGLVVVGLTALAIFNYFQRRRGVVDVPGVSVSVEEQKQNVYVVEKGDSLWKIAVNEYGDGFRWVDIWQANEDKISNPDLIFSGTELILPMLK